MAELPRALRVPRGQAAGSVQAVSRPRIQGTPISPIAGGIAAGVRQLVDVAADLSQAYDQAEVVVDAGAAVRQVNRLTLDAQQTIETRRESPRTYVDQFRALVDEHVQTITQGLSPRARAAAQNQINAALRNAESSLRAKGNEQFLADAGASLKADIDMYAAAVTRADTPTRKAEIRQDATELLDGAVATGLLTPAQKANALRQFDEQVAIQQTQVDIQLSPSMTLEVLQDDESSVSQALSPSNRAKLLDKAQQEVDAGVQREESAEKFAAWELAQSQNRLTQAYATRLSDPDLSFDALRAIQSDINDDARARNLGLSNQVQLSRWVQAMWTAKQNAATGGNAQLANMMDLALETARTPEQIQQIEEYITSNAHQLGDEIGRLLRRVNVRRQDTSMTNQIGYQEGLTLLKEAAGVVEEVSLVAIANQAQTDPRMAKLARAIDIYRQTMEPIYGGPQGFLAGDQQALDEARRIAALYFPTDPTMALPPQTQRFLLFENLEEFEAQRESLRHAELPQAVKLDTIRVMLQKLNRLGFSTTPQRGESQEARQ